jgi:hypothetical protein
MQLPTIVVGTRAQYQLWEVRAQEFLKSQQICPDQLDRVDSTINYTRNRITLFNLQDPSDEWSIADTLSHEILHSLLEQLGERWATRSMDMICKPVKSPERRGGV